MPLAELAVTLYAQVLTDLAPDRLIRRWIQRDGADLVLRGAGLRAGPRRVPVAKTFVLAVGKASLGLAEAIAELAPEAAGIAICPRSRAPGPARSGSRTSPRPPRLCGRIQVLLGEHPFPGRGSFAATAAALRAVAGLPQDATILFLLSGGASALFAAPAPGISRADKTRLHRLLVGSGLPIDAVNAIRRRVSAVKGGGLTELAAPRTVVTYALSDVVGDSPTVIGSGPTVADPHRQASSARSLLVRAGLWGEVPRSIRRRLEAPQERVSGRQRPGPYRIIASGRTAHAALTRRASAAGFVVRRIRRLLGGEAAECGRRIAADLPRQPRHPTAFVAVGETVVTLPAVGRTGRGGRSQELALAAAEPLARSGWVLLAAGTDGIDGASRAAGGIVDGASFGRLGRRRLRAALGAHESTSALAWLGGLVVTGPTGTNLGDVLLALHPGGSPTRRPLKNSARARPPARRVSRAP